MLASLGSGQRHRVMGKIGCSQDHRIDPWIITNTLVIGSYIIYLPFILAATK